MESYLLLLVMFAVLITGTVVVIDVFRKQTDIILRPFVNPDILIAIKRLISLSLLVGGLSNSSILILTKRTSMPMGEDGSIGMSQWLDSIVSAIFYAYQGLVWPMIIIVLGLLIAAAILKTKETV